MRNCENNIVLTALFGFSLWLFVGLPILYGHSQGADDGRPPIAEEQSEPTKPHNADANGSNGPASVALTRGSTPSTPLYIEPTCNDDNRGAECNKGWWQKFWADPIATFTGLLFVVTFFQAIFTVLSFNESRLANEAAKFAELNSTSALILSNRPYVFVRDFIPIPVGNPSAPDGWRCVIMWENSGATPTQDLRMWVNWGSYASPLPSNFEFPDLGDRRGESATIIPPRGQTSTIVFTLDFQHAIALMNKQAFTYIWGWAEYKDIFPNTPKRRTEFCVQVVASLLSSEPPTMMVEFRHYQTHNSAT